MELAIEVSGEVVERQELLNGTETLTLEGTAADGWTLTAMIAWNRGLVDYTGEGDITLARGGDELFGTVVSSSAQESPDGSGLLFHATYDIDGGLGEFESATGQIEAQGTLEGASFHGRWLARINEAGA